MSQNKPQDKQQQLESYRAIQARLTYLREDLHESHWTCSAQLARIASGKKFVAIRTAGGIHFASVSDVE